MSLLRPAGAGLSPGVERTLDLLRWTAAAVVVVTHIKSRVLSSGALEASWQGWASIPQLAWALPAGFAREAVMVFFVVSGFLVGGRVIENLRSDGDLQLGRYLLRRLNRMYVVLLPALVCGLVLDLAGVRLFGPQPLYAACLANMGWREFAGSAGFVQNILTEPLGTNGALWSLANEFWYYVLFPLVLLGLCARRPGWQRVAMLATAAGICVLVGPAILAYGTMWLIGAAVRVLMTPRWLTRGVAIGQFLAFLVLDRLLVRSAYRDDPWFDWWICFLAAISCGLLLLAMNGDRREPGRLLGWRWHRVAADASYSSYLSHLPLFAFVLAGLQAAGVIALHPASPTLTHHLIALGLLVLSLLWTALFYHLFERHSAATYRWMAARLRIHPG